MQGLKKEESDIFEGSRIYYNFIKSHITLNIRTPAEIANIELDLEGNK